MLKNIKIMSKICLVSLIFLNLRAGGFDEIKFPDDVTSHLNWLNWLGDHPKTTRAVGLLLAGTVAGQSRIFLTDPALKALTRRVVTDAKKDIVKGADEAWQVTKQQVPAYATKALDLACEYPVWTGFGVGVAVASAAIATGSSKGKSLVGATIPGSIAYLAADGRGVRQLASRVSKGAAAVADESAKIKDQTTKSAARSRQLTSLQNRIAESLAKTADATSEVLDQASTLAPRIAAVGRSIGASAAATVGALEEVSSLTAETKKFGSAAQDAAQQLKELQQRHKEYSAIRQVGHESVMAYLCGLKISGKKGWQRLDAAQHQEGDALAALSKQVSAGEKLLRADLSAINGSSAVPVR